MATDISQRLAALTAIGLLSAAALAQAAWPEKPITLVVPFPPGGPTDMVARVLAQNVGEQLGQPMVVDNKPGANGNIGNAFVAKAAPDGYTVLYNTSSAALSPALYKTLSYDVRKDLQPVALTAVVPMGLVVHPALPVRTVAELVDYAKKNPGKLTYGSGGNGNITHLTIFQIAQHFGIDAAHAPYRGSAPMDMDLVAGQIQFASDTISSIGPFVQADKLRLLAVTTAKRIQNFPQAPTLAESGMTGFEAGAWQGVMVPAGTPKPVVDRLNQAFLQALKDPGVLEKLRIQGTEPLGSTPEEYGDYLEKELVRWADVVKRSGLSLN